VDRLASRMNMSPRNFARLFKHNLAMTPGEYLRRVRVDAARKGLEETNEAVKSIAFDTGFRSSETMRRAFQTVPKVSPDVYRHRFQRTSDMKHPLRQHSAGDGLEQHVGPRLNLMGQPLRL
jgi:transcriptional regulator GlxA family with amidase domain